MRKIITLFVAVTWGILYTHAQDTLKAIKVFDLDVGDARSVYSMYIDSVGTTDGEAIFCFQQFLSTDTLKLIKTDFSGNVIEVTDNPYPDFSILNGDTLICRNNKVVINASSGDTIYKHFAYYCLRIAASFSQAYVYIENPYRNGRPSYVINCLNEKRIHETFMFGALCCSKSELYIIERDDDGQGLLITFDEKTGETIKTIHTVKEPVGLAVYRGKLYVYSQTDNAVYRLELPEKTTTVSSNQPSFVDIDNLFIYSYSYSPGFLYDRGPIGEVYLSVVSDEIFIKKKADVTQQKIENTVLGQMPAAQISWIDDDICTVIADEQSIQAGMGVFVEDDDMISVRPAYIRKEYKDLMELYPVKQVAIYGFTDEIIVQQKYDNNDEVDALLGSLGFRVESSPVSSGGSVRWHQIFVSKKSDIIAISNSLYETGFFYESNPRQILTVRDTHAESLDLSIIDFIYNSEGAKVYMYTLPGHFMITKDKQTDQTEIEAIINKYLTVSFYEWVGNDRCQVETDESLIDEAIAKIRNEELVKSANRSYLMQSDYESTLLNGTDYPSIYNFNQEIIISFKDGVSESIIDSLKNAYNISYIEDHTIYVSWIAPITADIFKIGNSLYESGYVKSAGPRMITGAKIHQASGSGTTGIKTPEINETANIVSESYYDLIGRRLDSPSGLTIVVTRYKDGTIRTEKKILR